MVIKYKAYRTNHGRCDVQQTYDSSSFVLRAATDVALDYLAQQSRDSWRRPAAAKLSKGKGFRDYFEIRFYAENIQQRPIGYFYPNDTEFVILLWATEKGGKLYPESWRDVCDRRRNEIESSSAGTVDFVR
jgi:hypothetical protein